MGTYFIGNEPEQELNLRKYKKTVSTFRIPIYLKGTLEKGLKTHGNLSKYLTHLIKKYRFLFYGNGLPFSKNVKTEYQKRGTKIFKKNFRPELRDWLELGIWASALNHSKCKLFTMLLEFEHKHENIVNERVFLSMTYVLTTPFNLRVPQGYRILRKGRSILVRGVRFFVPPD